MSYFTKRRAIMTQVNLAINLLLQTSGKKMLNVEKVA